MPIHQRLELPLAGFRRFQARREVRAAQEAELSRRDVGIAHRRGEPGAPAERRGEQQRPTKPGPCPHRFPMPRAEIPIVRQGVQACLQTNWCEIMLMPKRYPTGQLLFCIARVRSRAAAGD